MSTGRGELRGRRCVRLYRKAPNRHVDPVWGAQGKLLHPALRRRAVEYVRRELGISERRACCVPWPAQIDAATPGVPCVFRLFY